MAKKFLHIGCVFIGLPKTVAIDAALNQTQDEWIRYATNNWIIWTERNPQELFSVVKPYLATEDQFLVAELNLQQHTGWLAKWIWDWINARLTGQRITLADILSHVTPPPPPPFYEPPTSSNALTGLINKKFPLK